MSIDVRTIAIAKMTAIDVPVLQIDIMVMEVDICVLSVGMKMSIDT